jgi:two-component system, LytTR family, sensor kinase
VSNLASLFRYSFSVNRGLIRIEEELTIVRAYLEIEKLQLGGKLTTEIDVDEAALRDEVPVLSIQPLVENAVKHGVAARAGPGLVRLSIRRSVERITVEVLNSGSFREPAPDGERNGVGLANVQRRLALCYGGGCAVQICNENDATVVSFCVPVQVSVAAAV